MTTCKHKSCPSAFCPHCGEPMVPEGVHGEMIAYCRTQVRAAKNNVNKATRNGNIPFERRTYQSWSQTDWESHCRHELDRVPRLKELVEVWERRLKWVEGLR